jgi:hypothetical protein
MNFFWKKNIGKKIRGDLKKIERNIRAIKAVENKKEKTKSLIEKIKNEIDKVKDEVLEEAEELKTDPLIYPEYDPEIDALAESEKKLIDELKTNLETYRGLEKDAQTHEELNSLLGMLIDEEIKIENREKENKKIFDELINKTIRERQRNSPAAILPPLFTDGVEWANIQTVVRQLGGRCEIISGEHRAKILFPGSTRPVPFSEDLSLEELARQMRVQLANSMPSNRLPSTHTLRVALKCGDFREAV